MIHGIRAPIRGPGRNRKIANPSVCFDHCVVDRAVGAQFAATLIRFLEDPKLLLPGTA